MKVKWMLIQVVFWLACDIGILGHYAWQTRNLHQQRMILETPYRQAQWILHHTSSSNARQLTKRSQSTPAIRGSNFSERVLHSSRRFGLSLVSFQPTSSAHSGSEYKGVWRGTLKQWKAFFHKGAFGMNQVQSVFGTRCPAKSCFEITAVVKTDERKAS